MPLPDIAQPRTAGLSAGAAWRQEPLKQNPINKHTKSTWHEPNLHATCTHIQATQEHEMAWDRIATLLSFGSSCLPQNLAELELALWPPHPATTAALSFSLDSPTSFQQLHSQQRYTRPLTGWDSVVCKFIHQNQNSMSKFCKDLVLWLW